ncbi:MAG TPA: hypothetical protein VFL57_00150 [Bryobacteraceae bacterium]|nr:hypothetical protein [Bryobacteraceae bacterium]
MAGYCTNCGAPLGGAFCGACGHPAKPASTAAAPPPPAAATPSPVAATPARSGVGKPLMIIGGIVMAMIVLALAVLAVGVHFVRGRIAAYTGGGIGDSARSAQFRGKACGLLSRDEVQRALGVDIDRAVDVLDGNKPGCAYYTNPEAFAQLQRRAAEQARKDSGAMEGQPAPKTDNPLELLKHTREMEGLVKSLTLSQADKDGRVFAFSVEAGFGRQNWSALRTATALVPGFDEVSGVADRAVIGSFGHAMYVLKGDSMINLELMYVPEARTRGAELGRAIAARL